MKKLLAVAFGSALLFSAAGAQAVVLDPCSNGGFANLASGCLYAGNDHEADVENAISIATGVGVDITLYGKSDDNPSLFSYSNLKDKENNGVGSLTAAHTGAWNVIDGTLISYITVKGGTGFAVYEITPASASGVFSSLGLLNKGGQIPTVSHISFWTKDGGNTDVPEPAAIGLLGLGLVGLGFARRRK